MGGSHESDGRRFVAGDLAITSGSNDGLLDRVMGGEYFGCLGEVVTCLQRDFVGLNQLGILLELRIDPIQRWIQRTVI